MRYLIKFRYDGTKFHGFQRQNNVKSVQKTLEDALSKAFNCSILIKGSGRTDAGVHAIGQCAHFDYDGILTKKDLIDVNNILNKEINVFDIKRVNDSFHARHNVKQKTYIYKVNNDMYYEFYKGYYYQISYPLDIRKMKDASKLFVGTHDFRNFVSGFRLDYKTHIYKIKINKRKGIILFTFVGSGFYRYMVRNLVGALIDVGRGKCDYNTIKMMLENEADAKRLSVAPADGLYLVKIKY